MKKIFLYFGMCIFLSNLVLGASWWDSNWDNCKNITVTNPGSSTLTDYPIFLNVTYAAGMQADFDDVRILNGSCNSGVNDQLFAELENKTDSSYAAVWVKMNLSAGENIYAMYYGNAGASSDWDSSGNVWNSNFKNVMHMNNLTDSVGVKDATLEGNPVNVEALAGAGYEFDAIGDRLALENTEIVSAGSDFTWCGFFKPTNNDITNYLVYIRTTGGSDEVVKVAGYNDGNIDQWGDTGWGFYNDYAYSAGVWIQVCNVQASESYTKSYYNGVLDNSDETVTATYSATDYYIGGLSPFFNGTMDELWILDKAMTADEINMTYSNLLNYANTISFGAADEQPMPLTLYVNKSSGSCSDSYTRVQASNPATPWCSINQLSSKTLSGDTVKINTGFYNERVYVNAKALTDDIVITAVDGASVNLSYYYDDYYNSTNLDCWTNISDECQATNCWLSDGSCSANTGGDTTIHDADGNMFFRYDSLTKWNTTDEHDSFYTNTGTDEIYLRLSNASENPNNNDYIVSHWEKGAFVLDDNTGNGYWKISNITLFASNYNLYVEGTSNVVIDNVSTVGGTKGIYVRGEDTGVSNITIQNCNIDGTSNEVDWSWEDVKNDGTGMETFGIHVLKADGDNFTIYNNDVSDHFNGIGVEGATTGTDYASDVNISHNRISDIHDDGIETDLLQNSTIVEYNNVTDAFVAFSFAPGRCFEGCEANHNLFVATNGINYDDTTTRYGECFKTDEGLAGNTGNWTINHTTCYSNRFGLVGEVGQHDITWVNNIFYLNNSNDPIIRYSGLNSSGVWWDYNLYYKSGGDSDFFERWNNNSANSYDSLALALASSENPGWDANSNETNPLFTNVATGDFTPLYTSFACGVASDGGDIGALPCASDVFVVRVFDAVDNSSVSDFSVSIGGGSSVVWYYQEDYDALKVRDKYVYENYSKPVNAEFGSRWQVMHGDDFGVRNVTFPRSCWDAYFDVVVTRLYSYSKTSRAECWNGSGWQNVTALDSQVAGGYDWDVGSVSEVYDGDWDVGSHAFWEYEWRKCTGLSCTGARLVEDGVWWNLSTLYNYSTTSGVVVTNISSSDTSLYDVYVFGMDFYNSANYSYWDVGTNLNASVDRALVVNSVSWGGVVGYGGVNYTRNLSFSVNYTCPSTFGSESLVLDVEGVEEDYGVSCVGTSVFSGSYVRGVEGNASAELVLGVSSGGVEYFVWDVDSPSVEVNFSGVGEFDSTNANVSLRCVDNVSPLLEYNLSFNGVNVFFGNKSNNSVQNNGSAFLDGVNVAVGVCSDFFGSSTDSYSDQVFFKTLNLIDEIDNVAFDVTNISGVRVYFDDNSTYYDFQDEGNVSSVNLTWSDEAKLRFELKYASGDTIIRYVDLGLIGNSSVRVCANKEGVVHYEQLILSALEKEVVMKSVFADCLVGADYTRFAYQAAKILKVYTIDTLYYLYTYDGGVQVLLASVDGSLATYVNLDNLEFAAEGYDFGMDSTVLSFEKVDGASEVIIFYNNTVGSNVEASVVVKRLDTGDEVFSTSELSDPNSFQLNFNWATLSNVSNTTLFKIFVTGVDSDGVESVKSVHFDGKARHGVLSAGVGFALALLLMFFGYTLLISRVTFSWFGIFVCVAALGVLGLTITSWYVKFLGGLIFVVLLYTVIQMYESNYPTVS